MTDDTWDDDRDTCLGCGAPGYYEPDTNAFVSDKCVCGDEPHRLADPDCTSCGGSGYILFNNTCDCVDAKERAMEKNGNTFVPGDRVSIAVGPYDRNGKIAAQRGRGQIKDGTSDGRMKVAWEDGTETWEKPEELKGE